MRNLRWVVMIALLPALMACGERDNAGITFTVENRTGQTIRHVAIEGAEYPIGFGDIDAGQEGFVNDPRLDVPGEAILHWTDHHGRNHRDPLAIAAVLGRDYEGPVRVIVRRMGEIEVEGR